MTAAVVISTPEEMHELGRGIGGALRAGDLVVLTGPLGAGKTVLTQGIAVGLGVTTPVTSPTFVIARVHRDGRVPLVHVDAYRLGSLLEVDDLDLDAELAESATVVEWGAGLVEQLAASYLRVDIARGAEDETRHVELTASGPRWDEETLTTLASGSVR